MDLEKELPVIRDDKLVSGYIRMEQKSGLIGIYEKENPNTVWEDHCPWEAENELFEADYDRVMPWLEKAWTACRSLPSLASPRGAWRDQPPARRQPADRPGAGGANYWCCCGTQIGIGWGPGLTRELARWMVHGAADISMREFDPRRFGSYATRLAGDQGEGRLLPAPRNSVPALQPAGRAAGQAIAAVRDAEGQGRGVRRGVRPRAPALVCANGKVALRQNSNRWNSAITTPSAPVVDDMVAIEVRRPCARPPGSWMSPPSPRSRWRGRTPCVSGPADRQPDAAEARGHHA
jgi:hypothetical protein